MNDSNWSRFKDAFPIGSLVCGIVTKRRQHGFFVALPLEQRGHVDIINFREGFIVEDENAFPREGTACTALVVAYSEHQKQVGLDTRPFQKPFSQGTFDVEVGLRTNAQGLLEYHGVQTVNAYLHRGLTIISIKEGKAYFDKISETDDKSGLALTGSSILIAFSGRSNDQVKT